MKSDLLIMRSDFVFFTFGVRHRALIDYRVSKRKSSDGLSRAEDRRKQGLLHDSPGLLLFLTRNINIVPKLCTS